MNTQPLNVPILTSGHATAEATKAFADTTWQNHTQTSPDAWRILDGHTISKVTFGTLGFHKNTSPEKTILETTNSGCNTFDCSLNFSEKADLKAFGNAFSKCIEDGQVQRDQCVVLSKIQMAHLETFQAFYTEHIQTLNIEKTDYILIQEPELLILQGLSQEDTQNIALTLFEWLETLVIKGDIQGYGLSSQTFGAPTGIQTRTCLATYAELARTAAQNAWGRKKRSSFKLISAPFNLLETELLIEKSTWEFDKTGAKKECSTLDLASRMNIGVISQRPLNVLHPHFGAMRLIEFPESTTETPEHISGIAGQMQGLAHYTQIKEHLANQLSEEEQTSLEHTLQNINNQKTKSLRVHLNNFDTETAFHISCINALCSIPGITSVAHSFNTLSHTEDIVNLMQSADMHYIHEIFTPLKETK